VAVDGPIIANSKEFCLQAAVDGLGIAFPTEQLSAPYVAAGQLVQLLESWSAPFPGFYLCFPARRQMAPPLRAFIDTVAARIGMQPTVPSANLGR
jgi:DNA-binding transcriptional LysR family regulator